MIFLAWPQYVRTKPGLAYIQRNIFLLGTYHTNINTHSECSEIYVRTYLYTYARRIDVRVGSYG